MQPSRGFGLLEIIVTFVLILAAAGVTFAVFSSARAGSDASDLSNLMNVLVANTRTYLAANGISSVGVFAGNPNAATLSSIDVLPSGFPTTGQPVTRYGPIVFDTQSTAIGPAVTIDFTDIPDSVCSKIAWSMYSNFPPVAASPTAVPQVYIDGVGPITHASALSCDPTHAGAHDLKIYVYLSQ